MTEPLHPAIVHLPLGLALLLPLLTLGFGWALWTGRIGPRAWLVIAGLQAMLVGAGLLALSTGEREEDRVEAVVPETALARHEAYGEQFVWTAGIALAPAVLVLLSRRRAMTRAFVAATAAATLVVAAAAVRVGQAGGQLVYVHNAGAAYATAGGPNAADATDADSRLPRHNDDDDH